ncbi:MAG: anthranilate phosphoribosyltransferase [Actinomycetota bacterium]|jgi:anthranilate phosphoribosyltransferase|nr:anthranilate phosphoribosyltransferase [Actinomycetota bacterium]
MTDDFSWGHTLTSLLSGKDLSEHEASAAMTEIMEGAATPAQIAGFIVALRAKGETTDEIAGLVRTMRSFGEHVNVAGEVLDTCGTGGDRAGTFNVSTAAAFVCAGAGVKVAKHGNRAASSRCGSADVLEAMGVKIDLPPHAVETCIETAGIGFCFAPVFHPAMRHAGGTRRELGIATIFNFLGPLTNPAGARHQALGISDERMLHKMVDALGHLGSAHVVAFQGDRGLDELSLSGPSRVVELKGDEIKEWTIDPAELGIASAPLEAVAGGTPEENAAAIRRVFSGEQGAGRDIVVLNAAAGFLAADRASDMAAGVALAKDSIDSGGAARALEGLIAASNG